MMFDYLWHCSWKPAPWANAWRGVLFHVKWCLIIFGTVHENQHHELMPEEWVFFHVKNDIFDYLWFIFDYLQHCSWKPAPWANAWRGVLFHVKWCLIIFGTVHENQHHELMPEEWFFSCKKWHIWLSLIYLWLSSALFMKTSTMS